jgi:uncharacterized protein YgfB (UPF0149 family)
MPAIMSTFAEQLWNVPPGLSEALLHGTVCGLLCGAPGLSVLAYRRALIDLLEQVEDMHDDEVERFVTLTSEDLDAPDLSFEPLLPDHDVPLADRLTSLAEWAGGFVLGFEEVSGELEGEALEAFDDIVRIADLDADEVDETDAEFDYVDVTEHLKVAVLMVHDTVNSLDEESLDESE